MGEPTHHLLHLASIVEASDDAIVSQDLEGRVKTWNRGAERLFGYTADEIVGEMLTRVVPPECMEELREILREVREGRSVLRRETVRLRKDGSRVRVSLTVSPLITDGTVVGVSGIVRDVTELHRQRTRQALLARASATLGSSLRWEESLTEVVAFIAEWFRGWCLVSLRRGEEVHHVAVAHADPARTAAVRSLASRLVSPLDAPSGIGCVVRTGVPEYLPHIPEEEVEARLGEGRDVDLVRQLKLRAMLIVPLSWGETVHGALSLLSDAESERLSEEDIGLTRELAFHISAAIRNGELYREAEAERRRTRALLESIGHGVYGVDLQGRATFMNETGAALLGFESPEEVIGREMHGLIHHHRVDGSVYPLEDCPIHRAFRSGEAVRVEHEALFRADGTAFPCEYWSSPVFGDDAEIQGAVVSFTDITERRAREDLLGQHARRLQNLWDIDQAILAARDPREIADATASRLTELLERADCVAVLDCVDDRCVQLATRLRGAGEPPALPPSPAPEGLHAGRSLELEDRLDARGDPLSDALAQLGMRAALISPASAGETMEGVLVIASARPGAFTPSDRAIASEVSSQLAIALSQTRLRLALERHNEELEARVEERTRTIEERNAELESFAYSVSHDLRAPLRAMGGFSKALLEDYGDALDEDGRDYAERVVGAAARMDELIQDLLAYSRVARGEIEHADTDLDDVVASAATQLEAQLGARDAELVVERPLGRVWGHRASLAQVFSNLIANAVKFVPAERRPRVRIASERTEAGVEVCVEDNGIGIAPEHTERIFRVFERLHGREAYEGTGVGLAIVRKIMERSGGEVRVVSEVGRGSRFILTLPPAERTE